MSQQPGVHFVDPICGMAVTVDESTVACTFVEVTYFFCSTECRDLFARAPERHVIYLAHEAGSEHYGHRCPPQRLLQVQSSA